MAEPAAPRPTTAAAWIGQGALYMLFALFIGVFSTWPAYRHLPADQALIKLSFTHNGKRVSECRQLSPAELAKLPPNMRAPMQCPRERVPVVVELDIDGVQSVRHSASPSGLSKDGASAVYRRLPVAAGQHRITVRLKDSPGPAAFDYSRDESVTLKPAQVLVIDFDAEKGGITLR
ncbi:MAG: hypothetical protein JSS40_16620 [Proteobacteria bacterium]|nr:hypothetical protein [Pseudomonadota bacterium]